MNFKEKLIFVLKDAILVLAVGAIAIIGIFILRLLTFGSMKLIGETNIQLLLLKILELIHFGWTTAVALLFALDSLGRLVILLFGGSKIETKK